MGLSDSVLRTVPVTFLSDGEEYGGLAQYPGVASVVTSMSGRLMSPPVLTVKSMEHSPYPPP